MIAIGAGTFLIVMQNVYPFLSVTERVPAHILVVEGWVDNYAIQQAVAEFKAGRYDHVFTTGGPVVGSGGYINDYNTAASVGADLLRQAGIPADVLQMVPSHESGRDRTYSSAVALREYFRTHDLLGSKFNILTEAVHSRRTRLLFARAFDGNKTVGVIGVANPDFDGNQWWKYSEGVKSVTSEAVAYLYTKIFFRP